MRLSLKNNISASVALAFTPPGQFSSHKGSIQIHAERDHEASVSSKPDVVHAEVSVERPFSIRPPAEFSSFGPKEEKEFEKLVVKRTMRQASAEDEERFRELKLARQAHYASRYPNEVLANYERDQLVLQAKAFLTKHVKFIGTSH